MKPTEGINTMKERYNLEIAGISFSIVSDDGAEFVRKTEAMLDKNVNAILSQSSTFSKFDAVTFAALDICGELQKAEAKIKNLEAQIEILEANMKRLRVASAAEEKPAKAEKAEKSVKAEDKPSANEKKAQEKKIAPAEEAPVESSGSSRDQKFRQLEALLGSQLRFDVDK